MLLPSCRWTAWCCSCIASGSSWRRPTASGWMSSSSFCGTAACCRKAWPPWHACCCWRSWNSEQEAGCWAARRTSTTTAKLQTSIVGKTRVLSRTWFHSGTFCTCNTDHKASSVLQEKSKSAAHKLSHKRFLPDWLFGKCNTDVVPWMWNVQ